MKLLDRRYARQACGVTGSPLPCLPRQSDRCEQSRDAKAPPGYRQSLALCVIDSIQSTGVTYSSVESVVARLTVSTAGIRVRTRIMTGRQNSLPLSMSWAARINGRSESATETGHRRTLALR